MTNQSTVQKIDGRLLAKVDPEGKLNIAACLQCARCSSGCTMRLETDILPHHLNRMVLLGMERQVLESKAIWVCASCNTCVARCPMQVDTPALIDRLREMAGESAGEDVKRIRAFNEIMLGSMKKFGRVYEFGLMGHYKLKTRDFFSDVAKFPTMLLKGKMKLFPHFAKGRKSVSAIFDSARARRRAK